MTYFQIAARIMAAAVRSPLARSVARYAIRQATAAAVREIRKRTASRD
jgi:hypothetical protein